MINWIQGFLKDHTQQQGFDDAWKALPPYPVMFVPKKTSGEVPQWQGKDMRNLRGYFLRVPRSGVETAC